MTPGKGYNKRTTCTSLPGVSYLTFPGFSLTMNLYTDK